MVLLMAAPREERSVCSCWCISKMEVLERRAGLHCRVSSDRFVNYIRAQIMLPTMRLVPTYSVSMMFRARERRRSLVWVAIDIDADGLVSVWNGVSPTELMLWQSPNTFRWAHGVCGHRRE